MPAQTEEGRGRRLVHGFAADRRNFTLVATILGSSITFVDSTVVNVALPTIGRDLHLSLAGRQWIFLSYSLALASLYLIAGGIGDRLGQRSIFTGGVAGFAAASALAGAAPTGALLIGARTLQGIAGAFLTNGSLALLRSTFGRESGRAVGLWTAWGGISVIVGPPLGGAIVQYASWRWIFYVNVPVAFAAVALARAGAPEGAKPPPSEHRPFDVVGALALAGGFGFLTYALVEAPKLGFGSIWWAFALAIALLVGAGLWEVRSAEPLLPLPLFRIRNFAAANAITLLVYGALGGSTFFLVLYLQTVVGYSPLQSSLALVPISFVMLALAGRFGRLADRQGPRLYLTIGPALLGTGMLIWALVDRKSEWWLVGAGVLVFSVGLSVTVAPITATALAAAPDRFSGVAAGVNNTVSRLGGLIAVALLGLVVSLVFDARAEDPSARAFVGGAQTHSTHVASVDAFRAAMIVAASLAFAGALVALVALSNLEALATSRAERAPSPGSRPSTR